MLKEKIKANEEKIDKFVFYFSIIDILFFPYIWFLSTNYSLIIVCLWTLFKLKELIHTREFKISIVLVVLMFLSTLVSFISHPKVLSIGDEIWVQNIKMMIQYASYFLYYMMFIYCLKKYNMKIKNILLAFFGFAVILAIIYSINKGWFANIKGFWNSIDSYTIWYKQGIQIQYRYNFTWTDPNNPAYAFIAVMAFLLLNVKTNMVEKIFVCISTVFLVICTMSTGGALSFILVVIGLFIFSIIPKIKENIPKLNKKKVLTIIVVGVLAILAIIFIFKQFQKTSLYEEAIERIIGNSDEGSSSRIDIWKRILANTNIFSNMLLGTGGRQVIINNESIIAPHNGHLYFIYAYGMVFYVLFMYEFFRIRKNVSLKKFLFEIPIFIGFTINTIVGEQKFIILYLLLYTMTFINCNKIEEKSENSESTN